MIIKVYHTTALGNGDLIEKNGWEVDYTGINVFGRGIYFWESYDDAHRYGQFRYGNNNYEILSEDIPVTQHNSVSYDYNKARNSHIDSIAQGLISRGINVIIIPNPQIEDVTMAQAKGKAYLWLVDISRSHQVIEY
jgi:hypothetical protein